MKSIVLDLGGVLLRGKVFSVLDQIDSKEDQALLLPFFDGWEDLDLGTMSLQEKYDSCLFSESLQKKYGDFLLHYYQYRDVNYELLEFVRDLKKKNYSVYILSDNNWETYRYYSKDESFSFVDGWVLSCQYHLLKEDGGLFSVLFDQFSLEPNQCFFIDDKKENVDKGRSFSMNGFVWAENSNIQDLQKEMQKCQFL